MLKRVQAGQTITAIQAQTWNSLVDAVAGQAGGPGMIIGGGAIGMDRQSIQQMARRRAAPPSPSAFPAKIKSESNDYVTVRTWDGTAEGTADILVAKPYKLRHLAANYEGVSSITTTNASTIDATDGTDTETWNVTPSYQVNDVIYVERVKFTGVEVASEDLKHIDVNRDGRAWAAEIKSGEA